MMDAAVAEVFVLDDSDESDNDNEDILHEEGITEALNEEEDEDGDEDEDEAEDNDVDDRQLSCKKCGKKYHLQAWLKKHEDKCESNTDNTDQRRKKKSPTPAVNGDIAKLISDLNYDCYFETTAMPDLNNVLEEIARTTEDLIALRGERFANAVHLSRLFLQALKGSFEEGIKDQVKSLMKSVGEEVWLCIFGGDIFKRSDRKWGYSAQHIHHLRNDEEVKEAWMEMVNKIAERGNSLLIKDYLLLQKVISMFYNSISKYRCESTKITLHDDKACVIGVTREEEAIIRYIGGFTVKSLRNRFSRYITRYQTSTTNSVKQGVYCKTQSLRLLSQLISTDPGVQTPESSDSKNIEYSKLLVESLNRGGLHVINTSAYKLFLQIEFSIRPLLSLRSFLVTNTSESNSLLREICENSAV